MSDIPQVAIDRAVEAGGRAILCQGVDEAWEKHATESDRRQSLDDARFAVEACLPIIAEAAYRAGQEEAKARIKEAITTAFYEAALEDGDPSNADEYHAANVLALAAIDKEGEDREG